MSTIPPLPWDAPGMQCCGCGKTVDMSDERAGMLEMRAHVCQRTQHEEYFDATAIGDQFQRRILGGYK